MDKNKTSWEETRRPTQGVRQKLRDWLRTCGITEEFRIDRMKDGNALLVTSKMPLTLPIRFDGHPVHGKQRAEFILNKEERLCDARRLETKTLYIS